MIAGSLTTGPAPDHDGHLAEGVLYTAALSNIELQDAGTPAPSSSRTLSKGESSE